MTAKRGKKCIFCHASKIRSGHYVFYKSKYSLAMLNIFPYNNGHVMIAPLRHIAKLESLSEEEAVDLFRILKRTKALLDRVIRPKGYNIGINISSLAGAGIPGHLHIHIVPRWEGDTNFMPVISGTKVISESLKELYRKLKNDQKG